MTVRVPSEATSAHSRSINHRSHKEHNIQHWNKVGSSYNDDWAEVIAKLTTFVRSNLHRLPVTFPDAPSNSNESPSFSVLDYACGPGTVTDILRNHASQFVGLDISENMVQRYNERFRADISSGLRADAFVGDLLDPSGTPDFLDAAKFKNFNLVASSGAFHHFEDIQLATDRLSERLKPGGVLLVIDFKEHKPDDIIALDHPALPTISHHGFTDDQIREVFSAAGLEDMEVVNAEEEVAMPGGFSRLPFMAWAKKL